MAAPKFPLAKARELHKHLSDILDFCDSQGVGASDKPSARDNSDAGEQYAGDSARKTPRGGVPMHEAFPQLNRLRK